MNIFLIGYPIVINILAYSLMGVDKTNARQKKRRIPEVTLFLVALLGGSLGAVIGMNFFRHKTKHWCFVVGMPLILILQLAILFWLAR